MLYQVGVICSINLVWRLQSMQNNAKLERKWNYTEDNNGPTEDNVKKVETSCKVQNQTDRISFYLFWPFSGHDKDIGGAPEHVGRQASGVRRPWILTFLKFG